MALFLNRRLGKRSPSALVSKTTGERVEPRRSGLRVLGDEKQNKHPNRRDRHPAKMRESIQPNPKYSGSSGFRSGGAAHRSGGSHEGLQLLGAIRGDVLLPAGAGEVVARDRGRPGVLRRTVASSRARGAPARSTLSYANRVLPAALFEQVFYSVLARCQADAPAHRFRFKNKLLTLDSTVLELCASMFDCAQFRRTKGAAKLHLLLDHDGCLPVSLSESRRAACGAIGVTASHALPSEVVSAVNHLTAERQRSATPVLGATRASARGVTSIGVVGLPRFRGHGVEQI